MLPAAQQAARAAARTLATIPSRRARVVLPVVDLNQDDQLAKFLPYADQMLSSEVNFQHFAQFVKPPRPKNIELVIENATNPPPQLTLAGESTLDFQIHKDVAKEVIQSLIAFVRSPFAVVECLRGLESKLRQNFPINLPESFMPQYFLDGNHGFLTPGPPPDGYQPLHNSGKLLNEILLQDEQNVGLNRNGVPVFAGPVERNYANQIVFEGGAFKELPVGNLILHGTQTHRRMLAAIRIAEEKGFVDLLGMNSWQLLQMLTTIRVRDENNVLNTNFRSAWDFVMDITSDNLPLCDGKQPLNYSSRSPFVFNFLAMTYGQAFNLEALQQIELDDHYLSMQRIMENIRKNPRLKNEIKLMPNNELYHLTTSYLLVFNPSNISREFFFSKVENVVKHPDFQHLKPDPTFYGVFLENAQPLPEIKPSQAKILKSLNSEREIEV